MTELVGIVFSGSSALVIDEDAGEVIGAGPGDTSDSALIRQVKDDMRDCCLSKVIWVADRGFTFAENRRYLRKGSRSAVFIMPVLARPPPSRSRRTVKDSASKPSIPTTGTFPPSWSSMQAFRLSS